MFNINKVTTYTVTKNFKQFTPVQVPTKKGTRKGYKVTLSNFYPNMFNQVGFKQHLKNNITQYVNKKVTLTGKQLTNNTVVSNINVNKHNVTTTNKLPIITLKNHIYKWVYSNTNNKPTHKSNPLQGVKLTPQQLSLIHI